MLAGKGFNTVYNMAGGIKAWQGNKAVGSHELGMNLFTGKEAPEEVLTVAYSLEQGLRDFYLEMENKSSHPRARALFGKLAKIELKHQEDIVTTFNLLGSGPMDRAELKKKASARALEGGLSTREYLELFQPDLASPVDVVSLAMSIEAQALDLYQRMGSTLENPEARDMIQTIANEEKAHLASLGRLMDTL